MSSVRAKDDIVLCVISTEVSASIALAPMALTSKQICRRDGADRRGDDAQRCRARRDSCLSVCYD
jgi:ribosomal protein L40E